jgi:hypothetical protein
MALLTPLGAMLKDPLDVIGPPVSPAPLATLVTVPLPVFGKVCPLAKVITPLLAICSPVSVGAFAPDPYSRLKAPLGVGVPLPTASAWS